MSGGPIAPCRHRRQADSANCRNCIRRTQASLPVTKYREEIVEAVRRNQFVIIEAATGSGKSTQIPQFLLNDGFKGIVCTQPRRIAAVSLAQRVADEVGCELGTTVGYRVRFDRAVSKATVLTYVTDGLLLHELTTDIHASGYSVIMIDEVHQRTVNTDILMALLKKTCLESRPDLKVVVTSATLELEKFKRYLPEAVTIKVPGKLFPVDVEYEPTGSIQSIVHRIHRSNKPGDILIFLPGMKEIIETTKSLTSMLPRGNTIVLPLHSELPAKQQRKIFIPARPGCRKIICATNIAETSLTIEGVVYVIDSGRVRQTDYNTRSRIDVMTDADVSKQEADQRKGRAGRLQPGVCYRLYSMAHFDKLAVAPKAEVTRCDCTSSILYLKSLDCGDVTRLDFIDPPPASLVDACQLNLQELEATDAQHSITERGKLISRLPVDPFLGNAILTADELTCLRPVLMIVAMMSPDNKLPTKGSTVDGRFLHETGAHMTCLNVYKEWVEFGCEDRWCEENNINSMFMEQALKIFQQLEAIMIELGFNVTTDNEDNALACFIEKSGRNVAFRSPMNFNGGNDHIRYFTNNSTEPVYIHQRDPLASASPDAVIFQTVFRLKGRSYMQNCSQIPESHSKQFDERRKFLMANENVF